MSSDKLVDLNDLPDPQELTGVDHLPSPEELGEYKTKEAPGKLESFLRGGSQGATLGFADELTAGAESLLSDKSYDQALAESRANYKSAEEANPYTSIAGNIGGSIGGAVAGGLALAPLKGMGMLKSLTGAGEAVGALAKLKKAAAVGAGMGAITSAGTSENSVMEKPLALAEDVALGAGMGGAGGAVLSGAGSAIGKGLDKLKKVGAIDKMFHSFDVGKRGYSYFLPDDMERLEGEASKAAGETRDLIQEKLTNFGQAKKAMLDQAETEGKAIDITPLFNKAKTQIDDLTMDEIAAADKRKLQSILNALPPELDYGSIPPSKVDSIKRMFAQYTKFGDESLKTPEARKIAMDMVKSLDEQVLNSVDDSTAKAAILGMKQELGDEVSGYLTRAQGQKSTIKTMNKGLSELMSTNEILGQDSGNLADRTKQIQKLRGMIGRTASEGEGGITARETIKETKKILQDVAPEIAEETFNKAEGLADDLHLKKLAHGQISSGIGNLFGLGNIASVGGSNLAGSMYGSAKALSTPGTTAFRVMSKMASKSGDTGFSTALEKIANTADDSRRKAMVNTLMQTPYYRKKMEEIETKIKAMAGEDENDGSEN